MAPGDADHGRDAVFARDDRGVRERAAELGDDAGGDEEERREADVGRARDEDLAGLDGVEAARARFEHARAALDDAAARRQADERSPARAGAAPAAGGR